MSRRGGFLDPRTRIVVTTACRRYRNGAFCPPLSFRDLPGADRHRRIREREMKGRCEPGTRWCEAQCSARKVSTPPGNGLAPRTEPLGHSVGHAHSQVASNALTKRSSSRRLGVVLPAWNGTAADCAMLRGVRYVRNVRLRAANCTRHASHCTAPDGGSTRLATPSLKTSGCR